jgi:hydrogenase nickel incorporation protein HypA/HybF
MHEFSLATNIVEIVTDSVKNAKKSKVLKIVLEIGELAGIEEEALYTALESLATDTIIADAKIATKNTKGVAMCNECKTEFNLSDIFTLCPNCNGYNKEIVSGKEFNVLSIEAE